tara:strand:+ start:1834 stop:2037 length:204 start_codon:yes stop_codon:yes gene_type:complete
MDSSAKDLLKTFLGKKYPELMELIEKLPPEVRKVLAENAETFEELYNTKFNMPQIISGCKVSQEEEA